MHNRLIKLFQDNAGGAGRYEIRQEGDEATILLYDAIGGFFGISAETLVRDLQGITASRIRLRINSPGGDVFDARAIQTALRQHSAQVTAQIDGLAASAATFVALAADEVTIVEGGFFMIHNAWALVMGNAEEMRSFADTLEKVDGSIRADYAKKTGLEDKQLSDWMAAETWFDGKEAVEHGFVDGLADSGAGGPESRFNLSAYANPPEALTAKAEAPPAPAVSHSEMSKRLALYERLAA